jgi:hypothetical protein
MPRQGISRRTITGTPMTSTMPTGMSTPMGTRPATCMTIHMPWGTSTATNPNTSFAAPSC